MQIKIHAALLLVLISLTACSNGGQETASTQIDNYIVVLKSSQVRVAAAGAGLSAKEVSGQMVQALADEKRLRVSRVYSAALHGGVYEMNAAQAVEMAKNPNVAYVEKDQPISLHAIQGGATWGLDRIDQASLPLDQAYNSPDEGAVVNAYIIDTGVLNSHVEFQGRASSGRDFVDNDSDATDCNGHGTHVAGTIGSREYGVSKTAKLIGVRVLDCSGSGTTAGVIAGIDYVTANHVKPAVANMSLGGGVSQAIDDAIAASVQAGVTYVVAAGNENTDACDGSPSRVPSAITVGSTTRFDARSNFSNYGTCVDIFAPGSDIKSTWYTSSRATNTISGTSMATPHVAGAAALYLSRHPNATPAQVSQALIEGSVSGKISDVRSGSPNKLLNTSFILSGGGGGGGGTDPSQLQNGVALTGISGLRSEQKFFTVQVPAGRSNLLIEISGGNGDADLYVRDGSKPSLTSYDCRPFKNGNNEQCVFSSPVAGTFHVMINAYSTYNGLSVRASYR